MFFCEYALVFELHQNFIFFVSNIQNIQNINRTQRWKLGVYHNFKTE
jgi:hypothetical protein